MAATLILAAALAAQSVSIPGPNIPLIEQKDVAYDALVRGDAASAKADLEARLESQPGDPALLINLGAAHAKLGQMREAQAAYLAAADSDLNYRLELSDGRWMEARRAARLALRTLEQPQTLAMR